MPAEVAPAAKVLVFNFFITYKGWLFLSQPFLFNLIPIKNPLFRGISAVRFGKGSDRFDTNIKIKKHWKDCFSNNNSSNFLTRVVIKNKHKFTEQYTNV